VAIDPAKETLLTLAEACRRLGKCDDTVRGYIRKGVLEAVVLCGRLHTSEEAIRRAARPYEPEAAVAGARTQTASQRRAREKLRAMGVL
jgi:predicted site-specific integrase-resolvase